MRTLSIGIFLVWFSCPVVGQAPRIKESLTISDRAEWRKILKWPDHCEAGFPDYQKHFSDAGITFYRLAARDYLVAIGCSGSESIFIHYRENTSVPPRLLKFREYDVASGNAAVAYSTVRSLFPHEFKPRRKVLEISFTDKRDRCRAHYYRINHGHPLLLKTARCGLLIEPVPPPRVTPNKSLDRSGGSVFRIKPGAAKVE